jgi:hypothetical protein
MPSQLAIRGDTRQVEAMARETLAASQAASSLTVRERPAALIHHVDADVLS